MGRIFIDRDKLSYRYVPSSLPHREEQLEMLFAIFEEVAEGREIKYPRSAQLIGTVGAGKTSSSLLVGAKLEERARRIGVNLKHIYLNLKMEGLSPFLFYKSLLEKLGVKVSRSVSAEELLKKFIKRIEASRDELFIITIDEVDYYLKNVRGYGILYDLTRIHEATNGVLGKLVGFIFISRSKEWVKRLERAEASTIGGLVIYYPPYTKDQLVDILMYRASEALRPGAFSLDVIEYIAEVTAMYKDGDVRYALDVLQLSGILAEREMCSRIKLEHVKKAVGSLEPVFTSLDIEALGLHEKVVLLAALKELRRSRRPSLRLSVIREAYRLLAENYSLVPLSEQDFEIIVEKLADLGALELRGITRISLSPALNERLLEEAIREDLRALEGKGCRPRPSK